jgi:FolB domain-containing protein
MAPTDRNLQTSDRIEIRGLELLLFCGVLDEEQARRQPFRLDLDLYLDMASAGTSDDLVETVDYGAVIDTVSQTMTGERFQLLERAASRVAELVLGGEAEAESADAGSGVSVDAVTVQIHKLRPPVPSHVDSTGVRIHRWRNAAS